ncbi:MAG: hypothetical protein A2139_04845 [Desulfobacca sp. RBG_16_60_12]|nr:MAG: hypothetical protein A2139_04845 [Desulfobacca sp. RBG_16_60_12]
MEASTMTQTTDVQKSATEKESREHTTLQLAQHLAQQPGSTQALHQWMKRLMVAGVGIIVAAFIVAMYVSIAWKSVNPILIPVAWFAFAASVAPAMVFVGLDAIILRAFPPIVWPRRLPKFVTGSGAVWTGWAFILGALLAATFWGIFAYAVGTFNLAVLEPLIRILGGVVGIGAAISVLYSVYKKASRSR